MSSPAPGVLPNVLALVGHTPLVRLDKIAKENNLKCNLLAKLEGFSAGGSVKVSWLIRPVRGGACLVPELPTPTRSLSKPGS
jgi:hypothetical protein